MSETWQSFYLCLWNNCSFRLFHVRQQPDMKTDMANATDVKRGKGRPKGFDREEALRAALELFWEKGYEPTSVAELCQAMNINPPSLYCCFGNKAELFLEAVRHYEEKYWQAPAKRFMEEPDIYKAVEGYFNDASRILLAPHTPCGCMLVLAAINISPDEKKIIGAIRSMRMETKKMFADRLARAIQDGQIPPDSDVPALSGSLTTFLEGLSLQARDKPFLSELLSMAAYAPRILPPREGSC